MYRSKYGRGGIRRHRCEECKNIFECQECTQVMYDGIPTNRAADVQAQGLYAPKHKPLAYGKIPPWLCPNCESKAA